MIKLKSLINEESYRNMIFMSEQCAVFAIALHNLFHYEIEILKDCETGEIAHVYCRKNNIGIDFIGKRSIQEMKRYYHDIIPCTTSISVNQLLKLMGDTDDTPLYKFDEASYNDALIIIQSNTNKYKI